MDDKNFKPTDVGLKFGLKIVIQLVLNPFIRHRIVLCLYKAWISRYAVEQLTTYTGLTNYN